MRMTIARGKHSRRSRSRSKLGSFVVMALVIALAMSTMSAVVADGYPAITSPTADEVVYENLLYLSANDVDAEGNAVRWAVRYETCDAVADANRAGNVTGVDDPFTWEDGYFSAEVDITSWDAGRYCFVFNTELGEADGVRLTQWFFIVDEYAKVGGNVDNADYLLTYHGDEDLKVLRGAQLSHAFDGVVGNAGSSGTVGSITVNYRQLNEYVVFEGDSLSLSAAGGISVTDPTARAAVLTVGGSEIILLDKDASDLFPRGAAIVRYEGSPSHSIYEIDNTPGSTGADSWIGLVNGNVEVGIR